MKFTIPAIVLTALVALGAYTYSLAYEPPKAIQSESKNTKSETAATKTESGDDSERDSKTKKSVGKSKKMSGNTIYNKLSIEEKRVIIGKDTERPFIGKYTDFKGEGTYICKQCNAPLYYSTHKFESHCGWPSFDDEIEDAVKKQVDADGSGRVEIVCQNCDGHLGHIFEGERYTSKNIRHCVNSISMKFIAKGKELPKVIHKDDVEEESTGDRPPEKKSSSAPES